MNNDFPIPVPDRSGSGGSQIASDSSQMLVEARPFQSLHLATTIEGLASANSRAFGGEISATLIGAATRQLAIECSELKIEGRRQSDRIESLRDDLEIVRIKNAVLVEKISSDGRNKHLRNFGITVGTSLVGAGIALSRSGSDNYSYGAFVFGGLLLLLAWFSGSKEKK